MATKVWRTAGNDTSPKRYRVIKNSEVIKVGDWIIDESTGVANVDATSEEILGYVTAIVDNKKNSLEGPVVGSYTGTWDATTKQFTAAANNETVSMVMAEYVPAHEADQFKTALTANRGSTVNSGVIGYYLSISTSDSSKLNETTASSTPGQFRIAELPENPLEIVVEVVTRQLSA